MQTEKGLVMGAQGDAERKHHELVEKYSMLNEKHQSLVKAFDVTVKVC